MIVYKLRHKPTGLFFTPSKGRGNLSVKGKIYSTKPSLFRIKSIRIVINVYHKLNEANKIIINYFNIDLNNYKWCFDQYFDTNINDWEIIEL